MKFNYLTEEEVIKINETLIRKYSSSEIKGLKDRHLLSSALERPKQTVFGKDAYDNLWMKAAALFESLSQNHPFHNANKRTSLVAVGTFLFINRVRLAASEKDAEDFTVYIVTNKPSLNEIAKWLKDNSINNTKR